MGTVTGFDPAAEHEKTRAALGAVVPRLVRLLRDVPDLDSASGVPVWTVGDVGSHLSAVYVGYSSASSANGFMDSDSIPLAGEGLFSERIAAMNAMAIGIVGGNDRARLADLITEWGEVFLRVTENLAPHTPVTVPWFGQDITLATVTGLMLSESLVHGLDIARGAGLSWQISPHEARLALGQTLPTTMPLALDSEKARGVSIAFDLAIKGGPRLAVVVGEGTVAVARDAPPRAYDCRITASPTAFLLVSFRRTPTWKTIARGQMRASGRRPWLAMRLGELIDTP
ncbi:maleylpyruvate isomerase N-terminal domain-containing protein [Streptomyces xanthophaeus]